MVEAAAQFGARLVIFPELSLTGYSRSLSRADAVSVPDPVLRPLSDVSQRHRMLVVAGAPMPMANGISIASLSFAPTGEIGTYTKQHLHDGEEQAFMPGAGGPLLAMDTAWNVALAICAEINHPSHIAGAAARGADIYAASCFFTPNGYDVDCQRLKAYAALHRVVILMANFAAASGGFESAGRSAIWDDTGQLLIAAPPSGECVVGAERRNGRWTARAIPMASDRLHGPAN